VAERRAPNDVRIGAWQATHTQATSIETASARYRLCGALLAFVVIGRMGQAKDVDRRLLRWLWAGSVTWSVVCYVPYACHGYPRCRPTMRGIYHSQTSWQIPGPEAHFPLFNISAGSVKPM